MVDTKIVPVAIIAEPAAQCMALNSKISPTFGIIPQFYRARVPRQELVGGKKYNNLC
jgi:hypothetical protein